MATTPEPPFTRRVATVLLAIAVIVFLVGVISLALGWIEVATACAGVFTVMWLTMRMRLKKRAREADAASAPTAKAPTAKGPTAKEPEPRSGRRRRPR